MMGVKGKILCICRILLEWVGNACNAVTQIHGGNLKMAAKKTGEEATNSTDETTCKCENLIEMGFHRCSDNVIYITYLCEDCQKVLIKKYKLELIGELKYGA